MKGIKRVLLLSFLIILLLGFGTVFQDAPAPAIAAQQVYHGNVSSKVFHKPGCRHYDCKNCTAVFSTRDDAINAGYRPCKVCKP
jgi:hypothetical protein